MTFRKIKANVIFTSLVVCQQFAASRLFRPSFSSMFSEKSLFLPTIPIFAKNEFSNNKCVAKVFFEDEYNKYDTGHQSPIARVLEINTSTYGNIYGNILVNNVRTYQRLFD